MASALLDEFCKMEDVEVTVYADPEKADIVERFLQTAHPTLSVITFRALPHRRLQYHLKTWLEKREKNGKRPLRGSGRLVHLFDAFDVFTYDSDVTAFKKYDAFFSPCEAAPPAIEKSGIPVYTIIHDLIPIVTGEFPVRKGYWFYDVLQQVSPEKYYFCISECTKQDFIEHCPKADTAHIRVNYNGFVPREEVLTEADGQRIVEDAGLSWKKYLLILGNVVPHKNVERQIRSGVRFIKECMLNDYRIAVVGSCNDPDKILESAKVAQDDRSLVIFCGYVPDAHIGAYYKGAFCLSFTSMYEGFGLPVLEAMNEGCPVVTSNTSSLPEVAGDAALLIPPKDDEEHVNAYTRLLKEPTLRESLIARGKERVTHFKWDQTAKLMMDAMKNDRTV
ncbi:glycosyltransferase family 4 protein [Butyrivibrio sp. MB2005]|uniref:glycosyltransferase family 4 protein n=1 Tax=Butyrivibrio sp. MB2005 TaxID=1280678 RepID=UPI0018C8DD99|nr:glycosyltransferase family 1 protein [Butyrivibrio sp. MB2005]